MNATHDLLGIGVGPFNLGLAALAEPLDDLDAVFLESRDQFEWHPGMVLEDATLQVPFMADLVTMADPTSRFSYLNFLKQVGRLYPFYIRESFYPLRSEFVEYGRWVADQLDGVHFGRHVESVTHDGDEYVVRARVGSETQTYRARRLVLGTGTTPYVPEVAAEHVAGAAPALHSSAYLEHKAALLEHEDVTIIGSGQSAAEIYLDLLTSGGPRVTWITRSPRFFPMEYTKLTLEMTSPEYTAYFQGLPEVTRETLLREQRGLYKGISGDLVDTIYDTLYRLRAQGRADTRLLTATELTDLTWDSDAFSLRLRHTETGEAFGSGAGAVVLSTGYRSVVPAFLDGVRDRIRWDERGRYDATADYQVGVEPGEIWVQNGEEHTHGFVAPDLGMGAFRSSVILASMLGREVYPVESRIAVQEFGTPSWARLRESAR
ncbi:lysine N(6)-hydroxylase/L-ornithine N(5)-oxygenase family protein [Aeromicrobium sp. Leaf350]|uniref:lysine N(6)-hydroxylase/L-ornithine N(5)-oxygenase family protein n=1 Tax=Aeromicrobium sp. Leaf350 TaxID=2876565 RepID=UPI001E6450A0|nr:SidA/IucD/PvdA family monooxygenase [Aeromicrobium sp. Leaf350]